LFIFQVLKTIEARLVSVIMKTKLNYWKNHLALKGHGFVHEYIDAVTLQTEASGALTLTFRWS
jgi:xylose isomerase